MKSLELSLKSREYVILMNIKNYCLHHKMFIQFVKQSIKTNTIFARESKKKFNNSLDINEFF